MRQREHHERRLVAWGGFLVGLVVGAALTVLVIILAAWMLFAGGD